MRNLLDKLDNVLAESLNKSTDRFTVDSIQVEEYEGDVIAHIWWSVNEEEFSCSIDEGDDLFSTVSAEMLDTNIDYDVIYRIVDQIETELPAHGWEG